MTMATKEKVVEMLKLTLDPTTPPDVRIQAFHFIEEIRSDMKVMLELGMSLSVPDTPPVCRHFGLQLMEEAIKLHWNDYGQQEKVTIKEFTMQLLSTPSNDMLTEISSIKDRIARLVVEMVKREWPQQWPSFISELVQTAKMGNEQVELTMFVLLRLSEDVATIQTLEGKRRKDILQGLNQVMDNLFSFLFSILEEHYTAYSQQQPNTYERKCHCKIIQILFMVLGSFIEWVDPQHLWTHREKFFISICHLLSDEQLKVEVSNCLLQLVSRKGKGSDRVLVLQLFRQDFLTAILQSTNDHNYIHLKTIAQVLSILGLQLCQLWGKEPQVTEPENFSLYLDAILSLFEHASLTIYGCARAVWAQLFKNPLAAQSQTFKRFLPMVMKIAFTKVTLADENAEMDFFASMDFDDEEDFRNCVNKSRSDVFDLIAEMAQLKPNVYLEHLAPIAEMALSGTDDPKDSSQSSPHYRSWKALHQVLSKVLSKLLTDNRNEEVARTLEPLLVRISSHSTNEHLVLLEMLGCVSGLHAVMPHSTSVKTICDWLFFLLKTPLQFPAKSVCDVKIRTSEVFAKLCECQSSTFWPLFEPLFQSAKEMAPSNLGAISVYRGLLVLALHGDHSRVGHVFDLAFVEVPQVLSVFPQDSCDVGAFIHVLGLDVPEYSERGYSSRINGIFSLVMALLKLDGLAPEAIQTLRKACHSHVTPILPAIFVIMKTFNELWTDKAKRALHPVHKDVLQISTKMCKTLLKLKYDKQSDDLGRNQDYLWTLQENLILTIKAVMCCDPCAFFERQQLEKIVTQLVLFNIENLPDSKLRTITRHFMTEFCKLCPREAWQGTLIPVLSYFIPRMGIVLHQRWERLEELAKVSHDDDDTQVNLQEMIDDYTIRWLTRQFIEFLNESLLEKTESGQTPLKIIDSNDMDMDSLPTNEASDSCQPIKETLSALGIVLMELEEIRQCIISTLLLSINSLDSVSSRNSLKLLVASVKYLFDSKPMFFDDNTSRVIMGYVMKAYQKQSEISADVAPLVDCSFNLYLLLRPKCHILNEVIKMNIEPGPNQAKLAGVLDKMDERLLNPTINTSLPKEMKNIKANFKYVMKGCMCVPISEKLKQNIHIADLSPMYRQNRPKTTRLDDKVHDLDLNALFGQNFINNHD